MTKGEINRIGDSIRLESSNPSETILASLQSYRISHKEALSTIFNVLCKCSRTIEASAITTYRIKRIESIIRKLQRYPDMQLSRMWDIAGCRCIFSGNTQVYKLLKLIQQDASVKVKKIYNYIEMPQEEGYRSLHLFLEIPGSNVTIEVQIRNQIDHNWATLVEITDLLFNVRLKEYADNSQLLMFHRLLADKPNLSFEKKQIIIDTIKTFDYIQKLSNVFSKNYIQVRKRWLEIEGSGVKYFLIEAKADEVPRIHAFKNFSEAEATYFDVYKSNKNANIVLTHLAVANYQNMSVAYSNYILTFHTFLDDYYQILEDLIYDTMKNLSYIKFRSYYSQYTKALFAYASNFINELKEVNAFQPKRITRNKKPKFSSKEKEWITDMERQIRRNNERAVRLNKMLTNNLPHGIFYGWLFRHRIRSVNQSFNRKFNRLLNTPN
ncbi:MAG TPA: hypothetical protein VFE50_13770 [Cyclobacteriaceae bacterium]|nr:hypothetical protein [Cyclobacteriaceae bacterium]